MVGADPGDQADLRQIEYVELSQQGCGYVRGCFRVAYQGELDRIAFNQALVGIERTENLLWQAALLQEGQQMMLIQNRVAQNRVQHFYRLTMQHLEQLVFACCQGLMQTK